MVKTVAFVRVSSGQGAAGLTRAVIGPGGETTVAVPAVEAKLVA